MINRKKQISDIIENFRTVYKAMARIAPSFFRNLDITPTQMFILSLVKENRGINLKELAAMLCISSSAATQQVNDLVKRGYLNREVNDTDRRYIKIKLCEEKCDQIRMFEDRMIEEFTVFFDDLTDEELALYRKLNNKITNYISQRQVS
jgi:DNA-binding MarR family transcriptional regulator